MIVINIERNQAGNIVEFFVEGHADYAPSGEDIICAAVSAILQTAVFGLTNYLELTPEVEVKDGWLSCKIDSKMAQDVEVKAILETMVAGLEETEKSYSEYIEIRSVNMKNQ
ncbi:ribosomal-processing cysteine protease Prp [Natroniella sulfidigena]|uniref:ribosomal-processing cysteine protease Prp n=1 Tax=Natroniella sulfidigena TaxID=723921 RepID=UPI00200A9ED7|nr:ribosomal-processing cysteine protease Prp [Natroniella sulfidigena]MCK8815880.1 ribosomal-processing cysteine protease Prp [Natroniella sulfidigena]